MVKKEVLIINRFGLHARASVQLVRLASKFPCEISLDNNGIIKNAKSAMDIALLGASCGTTLTIIAKGEKENEAVNAISDLFAAHFFEDPHKLSPIDQPKGMKRITINTWKNNYIIVHDPDSKIRADLLNKLFITLVDKIDGNDQEIERAKRKGEYLLIAGHANIKYELLSSIFVEFLKKFKIGYNWKDVLSDKDKKLFNELNIIPTEDPSIGATGGGVPVDTFEIEKGINPLVVVLNMFDGVRTFGSCEGHLIKKLSQSRAYVTWKACSIDGLNYSTFLLKNAINNVWEKNGLIDDENFNFQQQTNKIKLTFNTGYWKPALLRTAPLPGENYYEFAFTYHFDFQKLVFDIIKDIAEHMINEKYEQAKEE